MARSGSRSRPRFLSTAVVVSMAIGALAGAAPAAAASPTVLPSTAPSWVAKATKTGSAVSTAKIQARVYLAPQGGLAAEAALATSVSTPGSADYRQFISAAQYAARFAPTAASVSAIRDYLSSNGLKVGGTGAQNSYVAFTGTVAAAERAFGVTINDYKHNGATVQAPGGALSVPASLASVVLTVEGLDTSEHFATTAVADAPTTAVADAPPPAGFRNARPCSIYYGQIKAKYQADFTTPLPQFNGKTLDYAPCGYTGPFLRAAYEGNTSLDGTGVTVAIVDAYAAPTIVSDAETYADNNGDGSYGPGQFTQTDAAKFTHANACGPSGWYGEETLDVEAVHAMAPGANIHFYGAASCFDDDLLDALARVVNDDQAQLVTNSWGEPEEGEDVEHDPRLRVDLPAGRARGDQLHVLLG